MREAIYILCALTSLLCAGLLVRGYRRNRTAFLMWSAICFGLLALNNFVLVIDLVLFPEVDLGLLRDGILLLSVLVLLYGQIWKLS
jgi:hypothetical protein